MSESVLPMFSSRSSIVSGVQLQHQSFQHPGLISFRMDSLDLLAVQGTLKSLPQHHSVSSVYFSHPFVSYMFIFIYSCALSSHPVVRLSFIEMSKPFTFNVVIERVRCK